jgi:hypothetical protein
VLTLRIWQVNLNHLVTNKLTYCKASLTCGTVTNVDIRQYTSSVRIEIRIHEIWNGSFMGIHGNVHGSIWNWMGLLSCPWKLHFKLFVTFAHIPLTLSSNAWVSWWLWKQQIGGARLPLILSSSIMVLVLCTERKMWVRRGVLRSTDTRKWCDAFTLTVRFFLFLANKACTVGLRRGPNRYICMYLQGFGQRRPELESNGKHLLSAHTGTAVI